ncbi:MULTISPECIES: hypothetical protein [Mycolicibacter]|uniref:Uncharacterized protein n=1 Tax=Mycolicibacter virginiensis TaxID=1795032 RepID=A0A9X7IPJ6_9MYCO|nr:MULTISPECIES: hypothetical protein [Mycobacteriaceae]OBG34707.1 hypothetical protein A5671_03855 [Mycolicibacter heraklionensis]OBJ29275.1 hypothetical protein A5631_17855 [Mycolicibacter heraklionensis]PQM52865.1 hypothetical protein C5U48_07695 [Mycolicibacter virginiensis]ULP49571.1 hypothetical protein MJO54_11355 [Mycolicibacter virginiensis]
MTSETTATDARETLSEKAEQQGWARTQRERVDVYSRGIYQVHAIWRDSTALNGGAHYEDGVLLAYTTDLAKTASWLAR